MIILQIIVAAITLGIIVLIYAVAHKLIQDHKQLHNKVDNDDEDLDLPKTL
jgi:hypothetical protein